MRKGPRSVRRLTSHRPPAAVPPPYRAVGRARVVTVPPAQRAAFRRRVWAWRLLLVGWTALTGLTAWATLWWAGPLALGCLAPMLAVLVLLASCASSDLREQETELWQGR